MATVYFHIGIMKTGTSAIQNFLFNNNDLLKEKGYYYPLTKLPIPNIFRMRNGHFLVYNGNNGNKGNTEEIWNKGWEQIGESLKEHENVIISDESIWYRQSWETFDGMNFWDKVQEELKKYNCDFKVIAYIRKQDEFVESYWDTAVKGDTRTKLTFDRYVNEKKYEFCELDYYKQIKYMQQAIGNERITIRCYEREQFKDNDLIADFMECIGLEMTDEYTPLDKKANLSLTGNFIEFKRIFNQIEKYPPLNNFLRYPIESASEESDGRFGHKSEPMLFFTEEKRKAFMDKYNEGNEKVAREILGREDGVLFYSKGKDLPVWKLDRENMHEDIIRVMGEIACRQYIENHKLRDMLAVQKKAINDSQKMIEKLEKKLNESDKKIKELEKKTKELDRQFVIRASRKISKIVKR